MFFYLSQFLSFLAMPMTIILILLISGFWLRKKKYGKKLMGSGIILLLLFSNQFLANVAMKAWEPDFKAFDKLPEYEVGIVLTGVTNLNKTAYDRTFFNKGADRATHAVQLYKLGKIKKILITGGKGLNPANPNTEAELLRDFMVMTGIPEQDILVEPAAKNTRENALFSKEILIQKGFNLDQNFLLITSAFHMPRSKGCFDKAGVLTDTFPVDYYSEDTRFSIPQLLQPDPYSIFMWHKLFKEWIGITVYWVVGYI
ncbi:YdcF family protein [Aquiflexum gelatinilyticum]|uniref:YdcF family protein n=1 Tax=Aquiflexum gelatinilyticum TaxID=2961943 RepID=A0A9X2P5A6_9BACT|nr:YdcF family protein [Aquiflexum gelatinilyticum]MCR9013797.1 YdcF family protein [Aquiflexum gelatinilyticum]